MECLGTMTCGLLRLAASSPGSRGFLQENMIHLFSGSVIISDNISSLMDGSCRGGGAILRHIFREIVWTSTTREEANSKSIDLPRSINITIVNDILSVLVTSIAENTSSVVLSKARTDSHRGNIITTASDLNLVVAIGEVFPLTNVASLRCVRFLDEEDSDAHVAHPFDHASVRHRSTSALVRGRRVSTPITNNRDKTTRITMTITPTQILDPRHFQALYVHEPLCTEVPEAGIFEVVATTILKCGFGLSGHGERVGRVGPRREGG